MNGKSATTALFDAVINRRVADVRAALRAGANPNAVHPQDGRTPLYIAAEFNRLKVASVLIRAGADVDQRVRYVSRVSRRITRDRVALGVAQHTRMLNLLLQAGADPNVQDSHGWTPLAEVMILGWTGYMNRMRLLLKAGALAGYKGRKGVTAADQIKATLRWHSDFVPPHRGRARRAQLRRALRALEAATAREEKRGWLTTA